MKCMKFVLSLDGGGLRGFLAGKVLRFIEERLDKDIYQVFDLVAATSVGAICAAGITHPNADGSRNLYNMTYMMDTLKEKAPYIFQKNVWRSYVSWFSGPVYSDEHIQQFLTDMFPRPIGDALTNVMFTSYDIKNRGPFFFKNFDPATKDIKMSEALRAATAAPTYFEPYKMTINGFERIMIDGGVFANNPALYAYADAKRLYSDCPIALLAIGTHRIVDTSEFEKTNLGRLSWIRPFIDVMFDSDNDGTQYAMERILEDRYFRVQCRLHPDKIAVLDRITKEDMLVLEEDADMMVQTHLPNLEKFCMLYEEENLKTSKS